MKTNFERTKPLARQKVALGCALTAGLLGGNAYAQAVTVNASALTAGGGLASSPNFQLVGSIGGAAAGYLSGAPTINLEAGFVGVAFGCDVATAAKDCDWDSIPNGVEATVSRDARVKDNDVFAQDRLFVMQMYRDALRREADTGGLAHWLTSLSGGATSRVMLARTFLYSIESDATQRLAARLYFATFGRIADTAGVRFWADQLASGATAQSVAQAFSESGEFQARYGNLDDRAFIDRLYRNILGRPADEAGLNFWVGQLTGSASVDRRSRGDLLLQFANSTEYRAAIDADVDVTILYTSLLRRAPDEAGLLFWANAIESGSNTLDGLIAAFIGSNEYRARFLPS
jgi:Domain of unknown function (DUF4214)